MALVLANRVQETATPNTTVSFTLTGAVSGFQTFAVIGDTNTTYYSATDSAGNWEVGEGTYSTTGPTLTRTTVYASSNSGSAVTFPSTVNVFVTYPSGKSVNLDASGNVSALGTVTSGTWQGSTVGVAYGGTGLTSYTLDGVVYASGTGTLATNSALTFNGTSLINSGVYTAPSNGSGAGTKVTIQGSTGTGQAGASGGNGFIELIGGGGISTWTTFGGIIPARRRGGINLQAGTAQGDAGGTYVSGSNINISGSAGTNNGTTVGPGSQIVITSGSTTKTDGLTSGASTVTFSSPNATVSSGLTLVAGIYGTSTGNNAGAAISVLGATTSAGGDIRLTPGPANASGAVSGKAYVTDPATNANNEIITTKSAATPTCAGIVFGITQSNCTSQNTTLGFQSNAGSNNGTAIGFQASTFGSASVAIGSNAYTCVGASGAVAVGYQANSVANNGIAIGRGTSAGANGIAIGAFTTASSGGIVLNATGSAMPCVSPNRTYINPIVYTPCSIGLNTLYYCNFTKELFNGPSAGGGGVCCATPTVAGKVYGRTDTVCGGNNTGLGNGINFGFANACTVVIGNSTTWNRFGGTCNVVIGAGANACCYAVGNVIVGKSAVVYCSTLNAVAVGKSAVANSYGVSIGVSALSGQNYNVAIGSSAFSASCSSIAIGRSASASFCMCFAPNAVAIGPFASTNGANTVAIGSSATTLGMAPFVSDGAIAIGNAASAGYQNAIAIGNGVTASGSNQTHIKPIRNAAGPFTLRYDPTTGEITYN